MYRQDFLCFYLVVSKFICNFATVKTKHRINNKNTFDYEQKRDIYYDRACNDSDQQQRRFYS